jgi:signal transduction histidine kinase/DNA-binding response OmpR family regulator
LSIFSTATDSDPRLLRARMDLLVRTVPGTWPFVLTLFAVVSAVMWPHVHAAVLLTWLGAMAAVTALRIVRVRRYAANADPSPAQVTLFHRQFVLGTALSGLGWGIAGAVLFPPDNLLYQSFLSFVLAGVTASAISVYAPVILAARLFLALTLLPLATVHLLLADQIHLAMGVLLLTFTALLLRISGIVHASVTDSLTLRFENEDLIGALTNAKQAAEQVNHKLKDEILQRRDTESKLIEARDRAEQAARAKSDFLATMSHEIRTPMNGVLGMTELILNTELSGKQRRFASTIRRSGEALLAIINDILDFSKIEAGKLEIQHTVFDLRQLVEDTVAFFAEQAQRKRLSLVAVYPPTTHAAYRGDPDRIRQILMNLIGNALKFTEAGEVVVRIKPLQTLAERDVLRFEVCDSGVGIKAEHQAHIFESFRQADGSTTRKFGGTGLGLTICARLVELMRGEIGVDSQSGRGSTFWFSIALTRMPASSIAAQIKASVEFTGKRVLVVDDHATNREILKHQLENWGMSYHGTANGGQGLKLLRQALAAGKPFDLAVLDRRLPDIEGIDLAKRIKADATLAPTRLIMLSSIDQLEQTGQWLQAGIEVYINKPVRQMELHDALSIALAVPGETASLLKPANPAPAAPTSQLGAHVLLAEDNPVNQELARTMLEDLGCTVVLVENGEEAVQAISDAPFDRMQRGYDVVLMDCQMPVLDGFEATRQIRRWEAHNNRNRPLPIVALTANALAGDRERCLKAGMSDYLSKPFTLEQLGNHIKRWMTLDVTVKQQVQREAAAAACAGLDADTSHDNVAALDQKILNDIRALQKDGKEEILPRIVDMYLKNSPKLLEKLQEAASTGNNDLLRNSAHSLKSASANLGATRLAQLCGELEKLGHDGGVAQALAPLGIVEFEFEAVCNALALEVGRKAA